MTRNPVGDQHPGDQHGGDQQRGDQHLGDQHGAAVVAALIGAAPRVPSQDPYLLAGAPVDAASAPGRGDDGDPDPDPELSDDAGLDEVSSLRNLIEWVVVLAAAVAVALLLRTFVFQSFWIPSESMEETLLTGDRILVNKTSYRLHDVNRGDVVVFRRPEDQVGEIRDLVKRVIGLEGDTIEGIDSTIYVNGQRLVEPYLDGASFNNFPPKVVPAGEMFVMGDNRDESFDSRRFGTIETDRLIGRAFVIFWPLDRIGSL